MLPSSLLFLAALAFLIPTGAGLMFPVDGEGERDAMILHISRGTAVVMLLWWVGSGREGGRVEEGCWASAAE